MTPDARDLAKSINFAKDRCGKLVLVILDALDDAEFGSSRIQQENPACTASEMDDISAFILRASNAAEMAGIMLDLALQKLRAKTDIGKEME